eukprot:TRINITY_DN3036_c0_g1_i1.p1 TRINITY_DN3036_c0_g1~~TRINITY_DN3036_c0_g1_i1.p1  ORF type:complete len:353 (+),score=101.85 TRINITY_DN3036_c0_g1_i1:73-1059(+)
MSSLPVIAQTKRFWPDAQAVLESVCRPVLLDEALKWSEEDRKQIEGVLVQGHFIVESSIKTTFPNLKIISNFGVGVDHIDHGNTIRELNQLGVKVSNTPNVLNGAVADVAIGLVIAAARNFIFVDQIARDPATKAFDSLLWGREVHGSTLGIVGMGRIGLDIAKRAALGFDMKVLYYNRTRKSPEEEKSVGGAEYAPLEDLLKESDFVVIAAPYSASTRHIINAASFDLMKRTAILVNISRGGLVDHDALVEALEKKKILGAGLDVTDPEPLPRDHPLLKMTNHVIILPHHGSATAKTRNAMAQLCIDNLSLGVKGESLKSEYVSSKM